MYVGIYWNILYFGEYRARRNLSEEKFGSFRYTESEINSAPLYDTFFSLRLIAQKRECCITYKTDAPLRQTIYVHFSDGLKEGRKFGQKETRRAKTCNAFTCAINKRWPPGTMHRVDLRGCLEWNILEMKNVRAGLPSMRKWFSSSLRERRTSPSIHPGNWTFVITIGKTRGNNLCLSRLYQNEPQRK